jgi:RNA polymerase sigma-70 factor (ECF subfamily)
MGRASGIPSISPCTPVGSAAVRRPLPFGPESAPDGPVREALDLARRAHEGEKHAQGALLTRLDRPLRTTLHRLLGADDDLDDLLQDVWIQILRSLPSYRGQAQLLVWAERIAVRTTFRYLRSRQRRTSEAASSSPSRPSNRYLAPRLALADFVDFEPNAEAREALRHLQALLDGLKPRCRAAFILFALDGKSLREIAARTCSSLPATKSRIIRARRRIATAAHADEALGEYVMHVPRPNRATGTSD